jgi:XTP/dITP diphosphohydrolase
VKLLLATTRQGKVAELRDLLGGLLEVVSLTDFPQLAEVEESGTTFEENAELKARAYAQATQLPALADDSGLCVDALGGRPGVASARYAPTDAERIEKLLKELKQVPTPKRTAHFQCALCLAVPGRPVQSEIGRCDGRIALAPKGENGFGYDPIFYLPKLARMMAELTREEKAKISHRGAAFSRMLPHLRALEGSWP